MKKLLGLICMVAGFWGCLPGREADLSAWTQELRQALIDGRGKNLERFFRLETYEREMAGWKYSLQNGFLDFSGTEVVPLSETAILVHVPTNNRPYSLTNEDSYFDFIYRIYELAREGGTYSITRRIGGEFNPDFVHLESRLEFRPSEQTVLIESTVTADLPSPHLVFKLAKEFEIAEFKIDGKTIPYRRLGYFVYVPWDRGKRIVFSLRGTLRGSRDNIEFFSLDPNCFFLRFGGFAAFPSPPPGNNGRYFFSEDKTKFDLTFVYPQAFTLLQYGDIVKESAVGGQKIMIVSSEGEWSDNLAVYAQDNWEVTTVPSGNARLRFYFPAKDRPTLDLLTKAIRGLFDWSYSFFQAYPESNLNFVILDRFVENSALNDGRSIIARDAQTHLHDTYIHEILHMIPQPLTKDDYLWIKEGFTNFLSFDFIEFRDGRKEFWAQQQRRFIHAFDQFTEPLAALTSTRIPTYVAAYQKGPWVYRMLASVIGEPAFQKAMREFGTMKGRKLAGPGEYFGIFEKISGRDLAGFQNQWLNRKENPTLRIGYSLEPIRGGYQLKVKIAQEQEGDIFRVPLDMAIETGSGRIQKTLWLDSREKEFVVPVDQAPVSVRFDPESRLFALLKTGKTSFLDPKNILRFGETKTLRFKSDSGPQEIEFQIIPKADLITMIRIDQGKTSVLELSPDLSPLHYYAVNGASVYKLDPVRGKIIFSDAAYDIAEPVYPEDFIIPLFSCVDWAKSASESLLFLRTGQKRCAGASAAGKRLSVKDTELNIDYFIGSLKMLIREGVPVEYSVDGGTKYVLIRR